MQPVTGLHIMSYKSKLMRFTALQPSITNQLHFQTVYGNLCTVREQLGVTQAQYQHHIAQVGLLSLLPAPVT